VSEPALIDAPAPGADHIAAIVSAWEGYLRAGDGGPSTGSLSYVYASQRRACTRRMALDLLYPGDRPEFTPDQLERMRRGVEREAAIVARLLQVGPRCTPPFSMIEGQKRFEIRDRDNRVLIVGKIDGRLYFGRGAPRPVFEVKSGESVRHVETIEDLERSPWTRHMLDQLLSYLLAESEPWGFLILDRPAVPKFLRVNLEDHLERAERFLADARIAVLARTGEGAMPPFTDDRAECRRCDHLGKSCAPPLDYGPGATIITDERLINLARICEENEPASKVYDRAWKELSKSLRGVELAIMGDYEVRGSWGKNTTYELPDDIKAKFKKVDEKGKFFLELDRIGAAPAGEGR